MINNKQVNIWRGSDPPPTIYHIWLYNDLQLKIYTGTEWITFINDTATVEKLLELIEKVNSLEQQVQSVKNNTINEKKISDNPVLTGDDISNTSEGSYINSNDSISDSLLQLDIILSTQIIE